MISGSIISRNSFVLLLCSLLFFGCRNNINQVSVELPTNEQTSGKVIAIIDGDTYDLLLESKSTIRIRMDGIDAPEKGMPFYRVAKNYLGELCFNKNITILKTDDDIHGRIVAKSYLEDGRELGQEMIKAGLAWHFKKYSSDKVLADLENQARKNKVGLWIEPNPLAPWEIRKLHRQGISTKDKFVNSENK